MTTMKNYIFRTILCLVMSLAFFSCKLQSNITTTEFTKQIDLQSINGTYLLPEENTDSLNISPRMQNLFSISHMVKNKDKELLKNKDFGKIAIFFDGKK